MGADRAQPQVDDDAASRLFRIAAAYRESQILAAVAQLRIADRLADGPKRADELAAEVGADEDALRRLLRVGVALGIVGRPGPGLYAQTELSELLRSDRPFRSSIIAITAAGHWLPWGRLTESVRTGRPTAEPALGADIWGHFRRHPDEARHFTELMGMISADIASAVVGAVDLSEANVIVDVGGSHGVLLAALLRANPQARGVLFDLPEVVADASPDPEIADRVDVVAGSFFEEIPGGADVYLLKNILHDWADGDCVRILSNCRSAMRPDGRVLAFEIVLPPDEESSEVSTLDLNMLVLLGGRERTEEEYRSLFAAAGLSLDEVLTLDSEFSVLSARPA
ncbi:MAG TPA: methyltransferase [Actinomycetota bacterium]|nr:methyltransferase [Actinomycetota bacterium]